MKNIITLLRPHQYVKNLFIFAPILFAFNITLQTLLEASIAFVLFSIIASSIYVLNDYMNIEEDKKHPRKSKRPLASGAISLANANFIFMFLAALGLIVAFTLSKELFGVLALYFVLNLLYSYKFKHIAYVDIFIIAAGFVLRLFAGSVATQTPLSMWIIIITFFLAIFLVLLKRRNNVLLQRFEIDEMKI